MEELADVVSFRLYDSLWGRGRPRFAERAVSLRSHWFLHIVLSFCQMNGTVMELASPWLSTLWAGFLVLLPEGQQWPLNPCSGRFIEGGPVSSPLRVLLDSHGGKLPGSCLLGPLTPKCWDPSWEECEATCDFLFLLGTEKHSVCFYS